jgi:hypothetical protein
LILLEVGRAEVLKVGTVQASRLSSKAGALIWAFPNVIWRESLVQPCSGGGPHPNTTKELRGNRECFGVAGRMG